MGMDIRADLIPYYGAAVFLLYSHYKPIENGTFIDLNDAFFKINIDGVVSLFYAKPNMKMFKIVVYRGYMGLLNGINVLGKSVEELYKLFPTVWFDDDEEIFLPEPEQGFYFEPDAYYKIVNAITVNIKEMEDNDTFFKYEW